MTEDKFIGKIHWEGGVLDALEYGLHVQDLDDQTTEFAAHWRELETIWRDQFEPAMTKVERYICVRSNPLSIRVEGQREWFHPSPALLFHINTVRDRFGTNGVPVA